MSLPLDQLYHYINQCAQQAWGDRVIIYRFFPHGSKDIANLSFLTDYNHDQNLLLCPQLYCNDQEPLNFDRYERETFLDHQALSIIQQYDIPKANLRDYPENVWDLAVLLHSEQGGQNLEKYRHSQFVTAYYWSHGLISRDWFRAAEYLDVEKQSNRQTFLIYNRAWAGTREYRLKFVDMLIDANLVDASKITVNARDPELDMHYTQYQFRNPQWQPQHTLENYFDRNITPSAHSADFDLEDYAVTDIEIVLETLFDDDRLHLTEKSLRPIACGQPFILVATPGSLAYLRQYGFQTYSDLWPEDYDTISDPVQRMTQIVALMKQIAQWDPNTQQHKLQQAKEIANFNRQHFFSQRFARLLEVELQTNLDRAFVELGRRSTSAKWLSVQDQTWRLSRQIKKSMLGKYTQQQWNDIVEKVTKINSKHAS